LWKQFNLNDGKFLNAGNQCVVRLMTPRGMRYEEAYAKAYPFNKLIDDMLSPQMIEDTAKIMVEAINQGIRINVIINNRVGGNAPRLAQKVSEKFLEVHFEKEHDDQNC